MELFRDSVGNVEQRAQRLQLSAAAIRQLQMIAAPMKPPRDPKLRMEYLVREQRRRLRAMGYGLRSSRRSGSARPIRCRNVIGHDPKSLGNRKRKALLREKRSRGESKKLRTRVKSSKRDRYVAKGGDRLRRDTLSKRLDSSEFATHTPRVRSTYGGVVLSTVESPLEEGELSHDSSDSEYSSLEYLSSSCEEEDSTECSD